MVELCPYGMGQVEIQRAVLSCRYVACVGLENSINMRKKRGAVIHKSVITLQY